MYVKPLSVWRAVLWVTIRKCKTFFFFPKIRTTASVWKFPLTVKRSWDIKKLMVSRFCIYLFSVFRCCRWCFLFCFCFIANNKKKCKNMFRAAQIRISPENLSFPGFFNISGHSGFFNFVGLPLSLTYFFFSFFSFDFLFFSFSFFSCILNMIPTDRVRIPEYRLCIL